MTWTTPTVRSAGDLITEAIWNQDVVANPVYLKTEVDKYALILENGAETAVSNSTTPTDMLSGTVPGNTLDTDKFIDVEHRGALVNNTGGNQTITIALLYGGTTVATTSRVYGTGATRLIHLRATIRGDGATNAQEAHMTMWDANDGGAADGIFILDAGTAAIDSTQDQPVAVRITLGAASASLSYTNKGSRVLGPKP